MNYSGKKILEKNPFFLYMLLLLHKRPIRAPVEAGRRLFSFTRREARHLFKKYRDARFVPWQLH